MLALHCTPILLSPARVLTASIALAFISPTFAQDQASPQHQLTSPVTGARFEIVQSGVVARLTFRLDRYSGAVAQLVSTKSDGLTWEDMNVLGLPRVTPTKPRFQIFTSGIAARYTFLLDSETGKTWQVVSGKRKNRDGKEVEEVLWEPFAE